MRMCSLVIASLVVASACGESDPGPGSLAGTMAFTYSGGVSGSFTAAGAVPSGNPNLSPWAIGGRSASEGLLVVSALVPRNASTHDQGALGIPRLSVGSSTVSASCTGGNCATMYLVRGASNTTSGYDVFCHLTSGTLTITSITTTRATGTFSGTGECNALAGGAPTSFSVSGGSFDVPLVSDLAG